MLPDLFRRLKPLYGPRIDALWIEYQLATPERKREIDELLTILAVRRLGIAIGDEKIVLEPPPAGLIGRGEYDVGQVLYPGIAAYPFRLPREELLRHTFILGPTGTGKSTLIIGLLQELLRDGVPFMCFDFKRNYRCLLATDAADVVVFTVGRDLAPVALDALAPPAALDFESWADALADVISASYLLMQGARNVLKSALLQAHRLHGIEVRLKHAYELAVAELGHVRPGSRRYGWLESTARSLEELSKGEFGRALNATLAASLPSLLERPVVFELEALGEDQKRFFCLYLLQAVLLYRKHATSERERLRHVLVFDESHNVFPRDQWGQLSVPSRLAREVREYGEGIIAATQQADVAESLIANSGIKVILRCDYPKDVEFASRLLQIDPKWLAKIPLGQAIARLPARYYLPFLFAYPAQPLKNTFIPDDVVRRRAKTLALSASAPADTVLDDKEYQLLADVAAHPISTITERYERLGWNPKVGNEVKDRVLAKRLATFEPVTTPTGRVKILTLTKAALAHVSPTRAWRHGGAEHEYWRHHLKRLLERHGWTVEEEYTVGNERTADLRATRADESLLVEIETGESDVAQNVAKCAGQPLLVFFTSVQAREKHRGAVAAVAHFTPADLDALAARVR